MAPRGRRSKGEHLLFSFLTCEANDVVRPNHTTAMPALLTTEEDWTTWLEGDAAEALKLQRSFPAERPSIVASDQRQDSALSAAGSGSCATGG